MVAGVQSTQSTQTEQCSL